MKLHVRPEADRDIQDAAQWYELQRPGLGNEFLDHLRFTFESILAFPLAHPGVHLDVRRALLKRLPFGVFYQTKKDLVVVLAVIHGHRDPGTWKSRL